MGGDNICDNNNSELLNYISKNGMIDLAYVQNEINMQKRKELLNRHPYKIWQGNDGYWNTYLPDNLKGRVRKKKKTQDEIENLVIEYWKEEIYNPTVKEVYLDWICGKLEREEIQPSTKNRYDRKFNECLSEFGKRKIKCIESYDIEKVCLESIHDNKLSTKGFSNLRTLLRGIFRYAKKRGYVDFSISEVLNDIEFSRKMFSKSMKNDDELAFMDDEVVAINNYFANHTMNMCDLGIALDFVTGLRPGELSGLKWIDITDNIIHVNRTEVRYENVNKKVVCEVRDFPKTEAGIRDVVVPKNKMWIIKKIRLMNPFGEYVFEKNGKRITVASFDRRIRTLCSKLDLTPKSMNKIRKTYCTILIDAKVDDSLIISQVGHTDIQTTRNYYYKNRKSNKQKIEVIDNVFAEAK